MGTTVAQAYVQILPTTTGIKGKLTSALSGACTSAGKSAGSSLGSTLASHVKKAIAAAGIGAAIGKTLTEGSKLQQSIGGIETLFKGPANKVKAYARESFKATGLSANEYMENVTSFSASLISSLGGNMKKAATLANTAMVDMGDNANKMGTNMDLITQTYQSLARGNYAMLDNLKLGYGGTKSEMQRLMSDAEKLTGEHYTVGDFGDTVKAIHAIQKNLGITGTTAREAATTFEGSFKQMKAAATDLLGNIALGKNLDAPLKNLVSSTKTFLIGNFLPMFKNIVDALPAVLDGLAPAINQILPVFIKGAGQILTSVIQLLAGAAPQFAALAVTLAGALVKGIAAVDWGAVGSTILKGIGDSFKSNPGATAAGIAALGIYMKTKLSGVFSTLGSVSGKIDGFSGLASSLKSAGETAYLETLIIGDKLKAGFSVAKSAAVTAFSGIRTGISTVLSGLSSVASTALNGLKTGISVAFSGIRTVVTTAIAGIRTAFTSMFAFMAANPFVAVVAGIALVVAGLVVLYNKSATFRNFVNSAVASIKAKVLAGVAAVAGVPAKISAILSSMRASMSAAFASIKSKITAFASACKTGGVRAISFLASGIRSMAKRPISAVTSIVTSAVSRVRAFAPRFTSAGMTIISHLASGVRGAASRVTAAVSSVVSRAASAARGVASRFVSIGRNIVTGIASGIRNGVGAVYNAIANMASNAVKRAQKAIQAHSPSRVFRDKVGRWIPEGVAVGITRNTAGLYAASAGMGDVVLNAAVPAINRSVSRSVNAISAVNSAVATQFDAGNGTADSIVSGTATALSATAGANNQTPQTITLYAYPNGPQMDKWIAQTYNRATRKGLK